MSDVTVRKALPEEIAEVGRITEAAYQADGLLDDDPTYAAHLADAAPRAAEADLLVAVDGDGRVLGSVTVMWRGGRFTEIAREGELEFRMLSVAPEARGRGVGETLARAVLAHARQEGYERVVMSSRVEMTTAHRLYQRLGFRRLPERDWQPKPGIQLLAFELDL
ncbi:GNAT family N-acetyltransferase [Amycolatopsis suaedae]|uniref:GNAT family N-acetyltransferase n=1 Tax=Amycolatopsis suaedae TaxID=2510978 RepID=A0A4Q7J9S5_9PSEU|nr:GNAT family N-acetyltransferase [Amycolatopsis suaedae]RZQ64521.1 GNAT family N-acetyltransferase [Amycolatopsis suaedae]